MSSNKPFRGVVLGASWRTGTRLLRLDKATSEIVEMPERDDFTPQFESIEPLVRKSLLYFDRIDWPNNNAVPQGQLPDADFLRSQRVFTRSNIDVPISAQDKMILECAARNQIGLVGWQVAGASYRPGGYGHPAAGADRTRQWHRSCL